MIAFALKIYNGRLKTTFFWVQSSSARKQGQYLLELRRVILYRQDFRKLGKRKLGRLEHVHDLKNLQNH